jgi:hypothetical protein
MAAIIVQAGNTVVPALLALEELGFEVSIEEGSTVATSEDGRFVADDPVAVLGLMKLVETRSRDWRASDEQIDAALQRFGLGR